MPSRALNVIRALYGSELRDPRRNNGGGMLRLGRGSRNGALVAGEDVIDLYGIRERWLTKKNVFLVVLLAIARWQLQNTDVYKTPG